MQFTDPPPQWLGILNEKISIDNIMIWGPNYALQQTKATTNQFWKDIFNFLKMYVMVIII